MIPALRALWQGGWVSWSGQHYQVPEMMIEPHPPQPVPILCGGESDAALRRAAGLCDGWIGTAYTFDDAAAYVAKLDALRREFGRAERTFRDHAGAHRSAVTGSLQAGAGHRYHGGDVCPWMAIPTVAAGDDVERYRGPIERFAETVVAQCR